ncbi:EAL domain-containing protein [Laribacter hongkongensis]|uniref:EAL and HDOD domain-containing protein n=1 Tax=Laribacter hongkongensis TaxID=168471 RepID=UPI001EFC99CB|nr:EAL domain-containing protein [Laribacter hongkongensis]MCG8992967.1 EAL domain-containing protein [Laribacter hongkongensis]MCG8999181.1 EAL domain-containing protein [Laribacter hongkongensis]MCG9001969.1 EAL domain-containing protein [Laribacter hongkongensis]MCG9005228.1 EAL domain-containing protein [Laribacter hongkongensis]MCG9007876.1 EAL domain-containing protein [Laribacter hongkongensis]
MKSIFIAQQPILDKNQKIVAYELLFRDSSENRANIATPTKASAQVIINALSEPGIVEKIQNNCFYINIDRDLLLSDLILLLPKENIVLEILEDIIIDEQIISRVKQLKNKGYKIALDDFIENENNKALIQYADIIKIDIRAHTAEDLPEKTKHLNRHKAIILAEKVETQLEFELCNELGFELFQGYFFAKPTIKTGKTANKSQASILKLLKLIVTDADTTELISHIKNDPAICYNLIRLANSAASQGHRHLESVSDIVIYLGRTQIARWLQLLLFTQDLRPSQAALLNTAAKRSFLMEKLASLYPDKKSLMDKAFLAGIVSLLNSLLEIPSETILEEIDASPELRNAILKHTGILGELLTIAEESETGIFEHTPKILNELHIKPTQLTNIQKLEVGNVLNLE